MTSIDFVITCWSEEAEALDPFALFTTQHLSDALALSLPSGKRWQWSPSPARTDGGTPAVRVEACYLLRASDASPDAPPADALALSLELRAHVLSGQFDEALSLALSAPGNFEQVPLKPGLSVTIGGLERRSDLNGATAKLIRYLSDKERWEARLVKPPEMTNPKVPKVEAIQLRPLNIRRPKVRCRSDGARFAEAFEAAREREAVALTAHQRERLDTCKGATEVHLKAASSFEKSVKICESAGAGVGGTSHQPS